MVYSRSKWTNSEPSLQSLINSDLNALVINSFLEILFKKIDELLVQKVPMYRKSSVGHSFWKLNSK